MTGHIGRAVNLLTPKRRWAQFSLGTLLLLVTALCVALAVQVNRARAQREVADLIAKLGGKVVYDYQEAPGREPRWDAKVPGPEWLKSRIGDDYFRRITAVYGGKEPFSDETLKQLSRLHAVRHLNLMYSAISDERLRYIGRIRSLVSLALHGTNIGDEGVSHLSGLSRLRYLGLSGTHVGDAGLKHLSGLSGLEILELDETQVTDVGVAVLRTLPRLKSLYVEATAVSEPIPGTEVEPPWPCPTLPFVVNSVPKFLDGTEYAVWAKDAFAAIRRAVRSRMGGAERIASFRIVDFSIEVRTAATRPRLKASGHLFWFSEGAPQQPEAVNEWVLLGSDRVTIRGDFSDADLLAICELTQRVADPGSKTVMSISRRDEGDVEVETGVVRGPLDGEGNHLILKKIDGQWQVESITSWVS